MSNISKIMKPFIFTVCLLLSFFVTTKGQDSVEISQLKPIQKPTKAELKKREKLIKKSGWKDIICVLGGDFQVTDFYLRVENKMLSNGKKVSVIKAELNSNALFFKGIEKEELVASVNTFGRITSNDKNIEGTFEDTVDFILTNEQISKPTTLFYQKTFVLPEGKYKLQFFVRDTQTGVIGVRGINFEVN
ncbi:MAG TPA: hypothetical protein PKY82_06065 [Pyrinomonadaceae bacterium]|nr:hypothetical protein [Pyrinomonadaceae bacterium]